MLSDKFFGMSLDLFKTQASQSSKQKNVEDIQINQRVRVKLALLPSSCIPFRKKYSNSPT